MKRISTAALAAILVSGAGALVVAPAIAKDKKEDAKGPQVSKDVATAINAAKTAILAKDYATADTELIKGEAAAKSDDEKYYVTYLRYALEAGKAQDAAGPNGSPDMSKLVGPLDALIANPKTPADIRPQVEFTRATMAYDAKDYPRAVTLFAAAQSHGSKETKLAYYLAQAKAATGDNSDMDKLAASGAPQNDDFYKAGIARAKAAGQRDQELVWLKRWLIASPKGTTWNLVLANYAFGPTPMAKLDKRQMVDLFRLMRQTNALVDQDYYEDYAQKAFDVGLPDETKSVIAEGKAKGKIAGAGNSNIQALLSQSNAQVASEGSFDALEKKAGASASGALSAQTGDAYLSRSNYPKAIELYKQALSKGAANADDVNIHLGIAQALSGDKAGAKTTFAAVKGAPRNELAGFWTTWLDSAPVN
jgi:hypothetical protein